MSFEVSDAKLKEAAEALGLNFDEVKELYDRAVKSSDGSPDSIEALKASISEARNAEATRKLVESLSNSQKQQLLAALKEEFPPGDDDEDDDDDDDDDKDGKDKTKKGDRFTRLEELTVKNTKAIEGLVVALKGAFQKSSGGDMAAEVAKYLESLTISDAAEFMVNKTEHPGQGKGGNADLEAIKKQLAEVQKAVAPLTSGTAAGFRDLFTSTELNQEGT